MKHDGGDLRKLLVYLRLESLPSLFTFVSLLGGEQSSPAAKITHPQKTAGQSNSNLQSVLKRPLEVHGLHMLEIGERQSSVMKDSETEDFSYRDPVVNAFHAFGQLNNVAVSGELQFVPEGSYAEILAGTAFDRGSDMVLLPWSENGRLAEATNPVLDTAHQTFTSGPHNLFIANFLSSVSCNAAIFINNGFGALPRKEARPLHRVATTISLRSNTGIPTAPIMDHSHHIFFPFFGGADDRVALRFVLRLAKNSNITATILYMNRRDSTNEIPDTFTSPEPSSTTTKEEIIIQSSPVFSNSASPSAEQAFFISIQDSLPHELESRVLFDSLDSTNPVSDAATRAKAEVGLSPCNAGDVVVVGRASTAGADPSFSLPSSPAHVTGGVSQSLGETAEAMLGAGVKASVLVVQAGKKEREV